MSTTGGDLAPRRPPGGGVRFGVWILHMALPVLALWLLLAQPQLDRIWQHRPSHFWLVVAVAGVNVALSIQVLRAARLRGDARLVLIGYAFMVAAGFLLLHALATPGVIVTTANGGFEIATPVGLALASAFFAVASTNFTAETSLRIAEREPLGRGVLIGLMVIWAVVSLAGLPPLAASFEERAEGPLRLIAIAAIALYVFAAFRLYLNHRRKPSVLLVALITAAVLLAEAMATIIFARSWQLSWWLWHLLMAAAFGFVAYSSYSEYRREGGSAGIFDGIVTRETTESIREEYGGALETLTSTLQRSAVSGITDQEIELIIEGLRSRFALTPGQSEVLSRAARSLATERDQGRRLGGLARIGASARIEATENEILDEIIEIIGETFAPDVVRIGLETHDGLVYPEGLVTAAWPADGERHSTQLVAGGEPTGVIEFARPVGRFLPTDTALIDTLAAEIGIVIENVRLYRQLDDLFRTYLSPDVASSLRADPSLARLGGSMVELTALFADLRGFTSFSERTDPEEVMETLNRYFGAVVPVILRNGGTVVQFIGDALLAVFDAPAPGPDHAFRGARSALEIQTAISAERGDSPDAPMFRIGVNTGKAIIGNVGSAEMRSFNVVGDAVNVASRLEGHAEPGSVLIGEATYQGITDRVVATDLGLLDLKGKNQPIRVYRLDGIIDE